LFVFVSFPCFSCFYLCQSLFSRLISQNNTEIAECLNRYFVEIGFKLTN
jgi:hypothetical protein